MRPKLDNPDAAVAAIAARQHGVITVTQLIQAGVSRSGVRRRVAAGRLHRIHRGVYAVGHPGLTREGRFAAAVKACGEGAALSHFSAAAHLGILGGEERHPEVTVATSRPRRHPGIVIHRTVKLHPADARHHRGIRCTSPARTLADLAANMPYRSLRRAVREAQSLGLVDVTGVLRTMVRLGPRRGRRRLRRVLAEGRVATRSVLEDVVLDLIAAGGFAMPAVNTPLWIGGRRVVPDFRWPAQRLIVEADSRTWHENPTARADDAERQALLEAHGERVLRVTWAQAVARPAETIRRIAAAGAPASNGPR